MLALQTVFTLRPALILTVALVFVFVLVAC